MGASLAVNYSREDALAVLWRRGELTFKLHSGQKLIYEKLAELPPSARQVVFLCGRRFGKSYLTLVLALEACLKRRNTRVLVCAPYKLQATEIAGPLMAKVAGDAPYGLINRHRSSHRWNFANGSTLILSGLDLVAEAIRGTEFDDIYLEESGSAAPHDFLYIINSILFPTLLKSRGRIFHVTTLSRLEDHPLHTDIIPKAEGQGALYKFPTAACPLYTQEQLDEMCAEVGGPKSIDWQREFECIQVRDGSIVAVPEFNYDIVREFQMPDHYKCWLAGDWGGVRDKTAFLMMAYDFSRGKILVFDEAVFEKHTTTPKIVHAVKDLEKKWLGKQPPRFVDCPGQLQVDLMDPRGMAFPVCLPQKDNFEASVNLVRTNIPNLEIHPRCESLIQTLKYARLNKARTDFERTEALGHADALMALCYGLRYVNRSNPFPSAAMHTHAGSHYVPENYDRNRNNSEAANTIRSLFKV
jgi:hypothetical protein